MVSQILDETIGFFQNLKSEKLNKFDDIDDKIDAVIDGNYQLQTSLKSLGQYIDTLTANTNVIKVHKNGNLEELVDDEMQQTVDTISLASKFLNDLMANPQLYNGNGGNIEVDEMLLACAKAITDAVAELIKASIKSQQEIISKGGTTKSDFYKKNSRWTEGLISASKAVAGATNVLIHTADGVLKQSNSHEELIVASNEVAASTAQLVAASRVKANFVSQAQDNLEIASSNVSKACKSLVVKVEGLLIRKDEEGEKEKRKY